MKRVLIIIFSKKNFLASNEYQIINNEIFEKLRTGVNNE